MISVRAPVGALNIANQDYGIGRGLCSIKFDNNYDDKYSFYLISRKDSLKMFERGSTYKAVTSEDIGELLCAKPPLKEQKIAKFLNHRTEVINSAITRLNQKLFILEEKRSSLITQVVSKGLNLNTALKDSGIERIGQIPEQWELKRTDWFLRVKKNQVLASDLGEEVLHYSIPSIRDNGDGKI